MATKVKKSPAKKNSKKKKMTKEGKVDKRTLNTGTNSKASIRTKESKGLLTPKQQEALKLVSLGCSAREAALIMNVASSTADNHKAAGMKVLGITKATLLVRKLIEMGITKPGDKLTPAQVKMFGSVPDGWNL